MADPNTPTDGQQIPIPPEIPAACAAQAREFLKTAMPMVAPMLNHLGTADIVDHPKETGDRMANEVAQNLSLPKFDKALHDLGDCVKHNR